MSNISKNRLQFHSNNTELIASMLAHVYHPMSQELVLLKRPYLMVMARFLRIPPMLLFGSPLKTKNTRKKCFAMQKQLILVLILISEKQKSVR